MTRIHILSPGFETPNGRALLYPFIVWSQALRANELDCRIFGGKTSRLTECDVLLVDSKFHRDRWQTGEAAVIEEFQQWKKYCRVIYCDTTDSSGWLQTSLLPVVDVYAKSQVLKDRSLYLSPMYGLRPYTDYYHRKFNVVDANPEFSRPVPDVAYLAKLRVSWNSGLADYSEWGVRRADLYRVIPLRTLLRFPKSYTAPTVQRRHDVSCRFGISYPRNTVSYQREMIRKQLANLRDTRKLKRHAYFNELRTSKVVVSPFGYGEITLKDFEVFLTGGVLFKPDMSHLETWPDFFRDGETMMTHSWDLSDFSATLNGAVENYARFQPLATAGQDRYRSHIAGPEAGEMFVTQLRSVIA